VENYVLAKARWLRGSHNEDDIRLLGFASRPSLSQVLGCLENCLSKIYYLNQVHAKNVHVAREYLMAWKDGGENYDYVSFR